MRTASLLPLVLLAACSETPAPSPPVARGEAITVMTYNVNFGLAGDPEGVYAIREIDADVVLLQETTEAWERAIRDELGAAYPHMSFRHCCRAGGLAVLSKFPVRDGDYLPAPTGWFPAWRLVVDSRIGPLQVLNLHLHPMVSERGSWVSGYFTTGDDRVKELDAFLPALDPALPTIVAGDLNETPDGAALERLARAGFRGAQRDASRRTWRWGTSLGDLSMQLDHILHDGRLEVVSVDVVERGRSDHFPVVARVQRADEGVD
jgi:endonuclease/exonuclease/phosphatase (EEP) superfamily protein YafD